MSVAKPPVQLSDAYLQRFSGIGRLYGQDALPYLLQGHFFIAGLGGVGTWVAEALVRSGVGEITLVDLDDVCITNTNRQLNALQSSIGQSKTEVMAQRLRDINPEVLVNVVDDFLDRDNLHEIISSKVDIVIDCIDAVHVKAALIAHCKRVAKVPIVTVGSAGGKRDPSQVTSSDLSKTENDPMFGKVRQLLYRFHSFARRSKDRRFRVIAVYSQEQMVYPKPDGQVCQTKSAMTEGVRLDCSGGFGAATMLTGTFGFVAAERAIDKYLMICRRSP